ncbi:hypothetical protein HDU76_008535, partial [Blyttiomyces sp. JEL0837]
MISEDGGAWFHDAPSAIGDAIGENKRILHPEATEGHHSIGKPLPEEGSSNIIPNEHYHHPITDETTQHQHPTFHNTNPIQLDTPNHHNHDHIKSRWSNYAIALKTGADVAHTRVPIQLLTFLKDVQNLILIGEQTGVHVGEYEMVDVYTGVYEAARERLMKKNGSRIFTSDVSGVGSETVTSTDDKARPAKERRDADSNLDLDQVRYRVIGGSTTIAEIMPTMVISSTLKGSRSDIDGTLSNNNHRHHSQKSSPNESSLGWILDAHKNLPGFSTLFTRFPNANWYLMIDDDTYLSLENLDKMLESYDPLESYYLGFANYFVGCDGVDSFRQGPKFAHGGSGILLSRGAVEKLMEGLDECLLRYRDCWAGDVRVGLCLRDVGVLLTPAKGFYRDPSHMDVNADTESTTILNAEKYTFFNATISDGGLSRDTKVSLVNADGFRQCREICLEEVGCVAWRYKRIQNNDGGGRMGGLGECWLVDRPFAKVDLRGDDVGLGEMVVG